MRARGCDRAGASEDRAGTVLEAAKANCSVDVLAGLLALGAEATGPADKPGDSPAHAAAAHGHPAALRALLDHGAAADAQNAEGWAPVRLRFHEAFLF